MNMKINQHMDTDYPRRACNVLCGIIGAVARILAALDASAKPDKQADSIEKLADKVEKEAGKK